MKKRTSPAAPATEKKTAPEFKGYATFEISGTVSDIYNGKNANYITVRVYNDNGYYTDIQVTCGKEYEISNGEHLTFYGVIKRYYDKNKGFSTVFSANDVDEATAETPFK